MDQLLLQARCRGGRGRRGRVRGRGHRRVRALRAPLTPARLLRVRERRARMSGLAGRLGAAAARDVRADVRVGDPDVVDDVQQVLGVHREDVRGGEHSPERDKVLTRSGESTRRI